MTPSPPDVDRATLRRSLVFFSGARFIPAFRFIRQNALGFAVVGICTAALVLKSREYLPFFPDDGFISLRYSNRLAHGHGLTWSDGEAVEGYSNLLWVIAMAFLGMLTPDMVSTARVFGVVSIAVAIAALAYAHRASRLMDMLPALAGGLAMVFTCEIQAWAIGGLEPALLVGLIAVTTVAAYGLIDALGPSPRLAALTGALLGLVALTRPDGLLFTGTTAAAVLLARRDKKAVGLVARMTAIAVCIALAQLVFRLFYYHAWVANTAHAKLALNPHRLSDGWTYVSGAEPYLHNLVVATVVSLVVACSDNRARKRVLVPAFGLLAWSGYICVIGGDIFPARRHLVVPVLFASMIVSLGVERMVRGGRVACLTAWTVAPFALFTLQAVQYIDPERDHALRDMWPWAGRPVGRFLSRAFGPAKPLIAVDAAGSVPYFASDLPCLDMLGLNDRYIAEHPPKDFGHGFLGHELGDGKYVLQRKPDIVDFWTPMGGDRSPWRSAVEMKATEEFGRLYREINFRTPPPEVIETRLWVREDGRIGLIRTESEVRIPGYFFASNRDSIAEMDASSRVGLRMEPSQVGRFSRLHLDSGRWRVETEASGGITARVFESRTAGAVGTTVDTVFDWPEAANVDLEVQATGSSVEHLDRVSLTRMPPP